MAEVLSRRSRMPAPADEVFRWHERPGAFERLAPPWQRIEVVERQGGIEPGGRVSLRLPFGPLKIGWRLEHRDYIAGRQFRDCQLSGPFRHWSHTHQVEPDGPDNSFLIDHIEYALPGGALGQKAAGGFVRRELDRLFAYRHAVTAADLAVHRRYAGVPNMRIAVAGASGLIGSALAPFLTTGGHDVHKLVRGAPNTPTDVPWDPAAGTISTDRLAGCQAVVNLAGEGIANRRWTERQKERILKSRIESTALIARTLPTLDPRPLVWVNASAIGFYGDRGEELLDEASCAGEGFLPDVCRQWEAATAPAADAGIRVVRIRFGIVLSPAGGALAKMLPPFRAGVGGRLGDGRQYMSWIDLDDVVGAIHHAIMNQAVSGPVNAVAPNPATNLEFTKTLGRVLGRPTIFPVPAAALRLIFGEMADAMLLSSTRVHPARLLETGYAFRCAQLEASLRHLLGK
ncbi:MAG TPA: TIGR01777 family oxidoreductase [Pirellulales bacterium]|nr:TIGR01777 family oxidoreductase [Pirellulales bacterium]